MSQNLDPYQLLFPNNTFTNTSKSNENIDGEFSVQNSQDYDKYKLDYYKKNIKIKDYNLYKYPINIDYFPNTQNLYDKEQLKNILKHFNTLDEQMKLDRNSYRYRLKAMLNIDLKAMEALNRKNLIDSRERSRRAYSEFSRKNKIKPVDVSNVKSALKLNEFYKDLYNKTRKSVNFCDMVQDEDTKLDLVDETENENENEAENENEGESKEFKSINECESKNTFTTCEDVTIKQFEPTGLPPYLRREKTFFNIKKAHIATIESSLDNLNTRINSASTQRTFTDTNTSSRMKYIFKPLFHNKSSFLLEDNNNSNSNNDSKGESKEDIKDNNSSTGKTVNFNFGLEQTRPAPVISIHERLNKNGSEDVMLENSPRLAQNISKPRNTPEKSMAIDERSNGDFILKKEDSVNSSVEIGPDGFLKKVTFKTMKKTFINSVEPASVVNQRRRQIRISEAREKILGSKPTEREQLNRLTVIQPFEDTKVLINIDKIPSDVLVDILNSETRLPTSYLVKPIKAFGYYTAKTKGFLDNHHQIRTSTRASSNKTPKNSRNLSVNRERTSFSNNF